MKNWYQNHVHRAVEAVANIRVMALKLVWLVWGQVQNMSICVLIAQVVVVLV